MKQNNYAGTIFNNPLSLANTPPAPLMAPSLLSPNKQSFALLIYPFLFQREKHAWKIFELGCRRTNCASQIGYMVKGHSLFHLYPSITNTRSSLGSFSPSSLYRCQSCVSWWYLTCTSWPGAVFCWLIGAGSVAPCHGLFFSLFFSFLQ